MKRKLLILFAVLLGSALLQCSPISRKSCESFEIDKIKSICQVWGLLKYYHPSVGGGEIDWDNKLLETLRIADTIHNKKQLNILFEHLIEYCNNYKENISDTVSLAGDLKFKRSLGWLKDTLCISKENIVQLYDLVINKKSYKNHFVSQNFDIGNLDFSNEKPYSDLSFPSKNLRLLALFRYWNIIYYFYPYLEINDVSWEEILHKYIPAFINADDSLDYHLAVLEFTSQLNDGHIWTESITIALHWGILSPPYKLICVANKPIINELFPDSLGKLFNVHIGDQILAIDNTPVEEIILSRSKYYSFSNPNQYNRRIYEELLITSKRDSIILDIKRKDEIFQETISTFYLFDLYDYLEKQEKEISAYRIINDSIGYINLKYLEVNEISHIMEKLLELDKIIIDVRNYPNGVLYELSKYFNPFPKEFVKIFIPDIANPGEFIWWEDPLLAGTDNNNNYKGKIVLLVNEQTQSHAEFTVMCLQTAPNVTTIGSMTAGTDGNVSVIKLPGGIDTYFTGIGIEYPDGTPTQRVGIKIDTIIRPQVQDLANNHDRLLDYAIGL